MNTPKIPRSKTSKLNKLEITSIPLFSPPNEMFVTQFHEIKKSRFSNVLELIQRQKVLRKLRRIFTSVTNVIYFLNKLKSGDKLSKLKTHMVITHPRFILEPRDPIKMYWDILMVQILLFNAFYLPYRWAFIYTTISSIFIIDTILDCFYCKLSLYFSGIDMILTFFTAYYQDEKIITDHRKIFYNYIKGWFIVDLIALFPSQEILHFIISTTTYSMMYNKGLRLLRVTKLFSIIRNSQFQENNKIQYIINMMNIQVAQLLKICMLFLIITHYFACFRYASTNLSYDDSDWVNVNHLEDGSYESLYITSMYWAIQTITTVGYGDSVSMSQNGYEYSNALFFMFIGTAFYSLILGNLTSFLEALDYQSKFYEMMQIMRDLFKNIQVLDNIKSQTTQYYTYNNRNNIIWSLQFQNWFSDLPICIQKDTSLFLAYDIVHSLSFFKINLNFTALILPAMKLLKFNLNDMIYLKGDPVDEIYFIIKGTAAYKTRYSKKLLTITQGSVLGEQEFFHAKKFIKTQFREQFAVALQDSVLISIDSDFFFKQLNLWPALRDYLGIIAFTRKKTIKETYFNYQQERKRELSNIQRLEQIKSANQIDTLKFNLQSTVDEQIIYDTSLINTRKTLQLLIKNKKRRVDELINKFRAVVNMVMFANRSIDKEMHLDKLARTQSLTIKNTRVLPLLLKRKYESMRVTMTKTYKVKFQRSNPFPKLKKLFPQEIEDIPTNPMNSSMCLTLDEPWAYLNKVDKQVYVLKSAKLFLKQSIKDLDQTILSISQLVSMM